MNHLKISIVSTLLKIQNTILTILEKIIWKNKPIDIKNILIYKNGNIGDIITAYPAIRTIRLEYPDANINLLTSPGSKKLTSAASILESQNLIDKIIYYYDGKLFSLFKQIRKKNFDICFIMSDDRTHFLRELRNLIFFSFLKIKYVLGFYVNTIQFFQNSFARKKPYPYQNEVYRNLESTNITTKPDIDLFEFNHNISLPIEQEIKKINNALVIATGAKLESKKWNLNNFFEIAKLWIKNKGDIVFVGNEEDKNDADIIISKIKEWKYRTESMFSVNKDYNFCNKTTLDETIFLIEKSVAMIANDSGPAHLSSLTKTKVITIQASQDFKLKWDPYLSTNFVFRPQRKEICNCSKELCGYCINDIQYSDVWTKLKELS